MPHDGMDNPVSVPVATRTLIAGGYRITGAQRQPSHIEINCEKADIFASVILYRFVLFETPEPLIDYLNLAQREAKKMGEALVVVAHEPGDEWLSWDQFLDALGGAVPVWQALTPNFSDIATTLGENRLPPEFKGEAWRLFEEAVADGLTFILGHRVRRLGGKKRGEPVSDLIARTPDDAILVVDAKASAKAFDVGVDTLRPLREYVQRQVKRQKGDLSVNAVILAANSFKQDEARLQELHSDFFVDTRIPLTYLKTQTLIAMIHHLEKAPHLRNKLQWARILCRGGLVRLAYFEDELEASQTEYVGRLL